MTGVFDSLCRHVEGLGVRVDDAWTDNPDEKGGVFYPYLREKPTIRITFDRRQLRWVDGELLWEPTATDEQEATITLAHEFGHFLSWQSNPEAWKAIHEANCKRHAATVAGNPMASFLTPEECSRIVQEEQLAWTLGRDHVPESLRAAYDARARKMVDGYKNELLGPVHAT